MVHICPLARARARLPNRTLDPAIGAVGQVNKLCILYTIYIIEIYYRDLFIYLCIYVNIVNIFYAKL